jgi:hypothetical protein
VITELQPFVEAQAARLSDLTGNVRQILQSLSIEQRREEVFQFRSGLAADMMVCRQACWLKSLAVFNTDPGTFGTVTYIQLFDLVAPAAYQQVPDLVIPISPNEDVSLDFADGLFFSQGLYVAQSSAVEWLHKHRPALMFSNPASSEPWNYFYGTYHLDL